MSQTVRVTSPSAKLRIGGSAGEAQVPTLINQPTLRPTRKMAAVGWTSLLGPVVAAVIAP